MSTAFLSAGLFSEIALAPLATNSDSPRWTSVKSSSFFDQSSTCVSLLICSCSMPYSRESSFMCSIFINCISSSSGEGRFSWLGKVALKSYSSFPAEICSINSAGSSMHLTDLPIDPRIILAMLSIVKSNLWNLSTPFTSRP